MSKSESSSRQSQWALHRKRKHLTGETMKSEGKLNQGPCVSHTTQIDQSEGDKRRGFVPCTLISNCFCRFSTMCAFLL